MLLMAMTATTFVSSTSTVQAYAVAPQHTMAAVNATALDRHTHAGMGPLFVPPLTAQPVLCTGVQTGPHATMTALQL